MAAVGLFSIETWKENETTLDGATLTGMDFVKAWIRHMLAPATLDDCVAKIREHHEARPFDALLYQTQAFPVVFFCAGDLRARGRRPRSRARRDGGVAGPVRQGRGHGERAEPDPEPVRRLRVGGGRRPARDVFRPSSPTRPVGADVRHALPLARLLRDRLHAAAGQRLARGLRAPRPRDRDARAGLPALAPHAARPPRPGERSRGQSSRGPSARRAAPGTSSATTSASRTARPPAARTCSRTTSSRRRAGASTTRRPTRRPRRPSRPSSRSTAAWASSASAPCARAASSRC